MKKKNLAKASYPKDKNSNQTHKPKQEEKRY
jgi:hypothetical protein